jgi:hypothetical protein
MVEPVELGRALAAFLGGDRFRKFVRQGVRKGRLRYWETSPVGRVKSPIEKMTPANNGDVDRPGEESPRNGSGHGVAPGGAP